MLLMTQNETTLYQVQLDCVFFHQSGCLYLGVASLAKLSGKYV
jgi:hypothetical protein